MQYRARTRTITAKLSERELVAFKKVSHALEMNQSEFIRQCIIEKMEALGIEVAGVYSKSHDESQQSQTEEHQ